MGIQTQKLTWNHYLNKQKVYAVLKWRVWILAVLVSTVATKCQKMTNYFICYIRFLKEEI